MTTTDMINAALEAAHIATRAPGAFVPIENGPGAAFRAELNAALHSFTARAAYLQVRVGNFGDDDQPEKARADLVQYVTVACRAIAHAYGLEFRGSDAAEVFERNHDRILMQHQGQGDMFGLGDSRPVARVGDQLLLQFDSLGERHAVLVSVTPPEPDRTREHDL